MVSVPRRRLAWFTPLSPRRSGVSDYSEELLPHLGELADIDVVVGDYTPAADALGDRFPILDVAEFRRRASEYDAAIYQVANNFPDHGYMLPALVEHPGIVVLHDYCLQYLMLGATLLRGDLEALREVLRPVYGERASQLARGLLLGRVDPLQLSFAGPLVDLARGLLVHSHLAANCVRKDRPDAAVATIAMPVPGDSLEPPAELRARYGLADDDFLLASAGSLAYTKRLDLVLAALPCLLPRFPRLKLLVIGGGPLGSRARSFVHRAGIEAAVVQTGWVSARAYRDLIRVSDVVVDLRHPSSAETSASLSRAMAAGRPLIVSAQGTFVELPDAGCARLPVDGRETDALIRMLGELIPDAKRRRAMGRACHDYAREHASLEGAARGYLAFVEEVITSRAQPRCVGAPWLASHGSALGRGGIAALFALSRLRDLQRRYGLADTLSRLGAEGQRRLRLDVSSGGRGDAA